MNRGTLNLVIDLMAAFCLLAMMATGYILRFPLPPTTNRTHELWRMSRHEWGSIHSWASLVLVAILVTHVILHWEWLFATIRRRFTALKAPPHQCLIAGIITLASLMAICSLFGWAAQTGVRKLPTPLHPLAAPDETVSIPPMNDSVPQAVNFMRDAMPVFEASCISCHGPKKQRAKFRGDRREDFFAPGDPKPLIVPCNWEKSRLRDIVTGKEKDMKSAEEHLLPAREIALLQTWINAGANWEDKEPATAPIPQP
jgi:hypothetical protein